MGGKEHLQMEKECMHPGREGALGILCGLSSEKRWCSGRGQNSALH